MRWAVQPTRLALILCAVVVALIPALRGEFVWNARALAAAVTHWRDSDYSMAVLGRASQVGIEKFDPKRELDGHPRDVKLRIALAAPGGEWMLEALGEMGRTDDLGERMGILLSAESEQHAESRRAMGEALRMAPRDPRVYAACAARFLCSERLRFYRHEAGVWDRAERKHRPTDPGPKEKAMRAGDIAEPIRILDRWVLCDPNNAAPDMVASYLLLGARQDAKALARAEAGAAKRFFTLRECEIAGAQVHAFRLRGVPRTDAESLGSTLGTYMHAYARLREWARMMHALGWEAYDTGDRERAFRYWMAGGRIGTLMLTYERAPLMTRLVAVPVQGIVLRPIWGIAWRVRGLGSEATGLEKGKAYRAFVAARGKRAALQVRKDLALALALRRRFEVFEPTSGPTLRLYELCVMARQVSIAAMLFMLPVAVGALVALLLARRCEKGLRRVWSGVIVGVALTATMGPALAANVVGWVDLVHPLPEGREYPELTLPPWPWLPLALAVGLPVLIAALAAVASAWVARKKQVRYRTVFGGAMRQSLLSAVAVLAIAWVGATSVAVRQGGIYRRYMARFRQVGELRMLEEFAADHGIRWRRSDR